LEVDSSPAYVRASLEALEGLLDPLSALEKSASGVCRACQAAAICDDTRRGGSTVRPRDRETAHQGHTAHPGASRVKSMDSYQKLRQLVEQAAEDIEKAEGGNKAAGTRARQTMQEVKNLAQEIRKEILTLRGD